MDDFHFSISEDAKRFIQRLMPVGETSDQFVLTVAPTTEATTWSLENSSIEQVTAEIKKAAAGTDPRKMTYRWEVGVSRRSRFPPEDIFSCDGVVCFIPKELKAVLDGRALVVSENQLRIHPEPISPNPLPAKT
jgi:hypothetical protein